LGKTETERIGRESKRKQRFLKKARKNFLSPPAFERPNCGHSKAGGIKSFLVTFFKKVTASANRYQRQAQ
jgi:hypothetical protein